MKIDELVAAAQIIAMSDVADPTPGWGPWYRPPRRRQTDEEAQRAIAAAEEKRARRRAKRANR